MSVQEFIENIRCIERDLLQYLDHDEDVEENYQNLNFAFVNQKIPENPHNLKTLLNLISKIVKNHYRYPNIFQKIEKIIKNFKDEIKQSFQNYELFNIFKSNKRILLFLIQEKFIVLDQQIISKITTPKYNQAKYSDYFYPELNQNDYRKIPDDFEEKRKIGENDEIICKFIQKDLIDEFISHVNKNNINLNSIIKSSIYETNNFLLDKKVTLIEYASFFGSTQIFKYLYKNNAMLTPSLWIFTIHSDNPEIFNILEEIKVQNRNFEKLFFESISCHHNDMANYILNNYIPNTKNIKDDILIYCLKSCNFEFVQLRFDEDSLFFLIKYDYYPLVKLLLTEKKIDVNQMYAIDDKVETMLFYAYDTCNNDIINLLLSNENIDINLPRNNNGKNVEETLLCVAIEKGDDKFVQILLNNKKIDINAPKRTYCRYKIKVGKRFQKEYYEKTPLRIAIENKNYKIAKLLLSNQNININYQNKNVPIKTPLYAAIENENIEIIKLLLSNETIDVNQQNLLEIHKTTNCKLSTSKSRYKYRYKHRSKFINETETPLLLAVKKGNIEIVKLLLSNEKIDVNIASSKNETPFGVAIENDKSDIIDLLLSNKNIDINLPSYYYYELITPLCIAIKKNNNKLAKLLLSNKNINVNYSDDENGKERIETPLGAAINVKENIELIKLLLSIENIDVNQQSHNMTPLYEAVSCRDIEVIKLLLSNKNIDVNIQNKIDHKTPLFCAVENKYYDIVKLLLSKENIDVNIVIKSWRYDESVLFIAVLNNDIEMVRLLLTNKNIDVNIIYNSYIEIRTRHRRPNQYLPPQGFNSKQIGSKNTALFVAVKNNNVDIVRLLLANENIDVNKINIIYEYDSTYKTTSKLTAFDIARQNENSEIIDLLESKK